MRLALAYRSLPRPSTASKHSHPLYGLQNSINRSVYQCTTIIAKTRRDARISYALRAKTTWHDSLQTVKCRKHKIFFFYFTRGIVLLARLFASGAITAFQLVTNDGLAPMLLKASSSGCLNLR